MTKEEKYDLKWYQRQKDIIDQQIQCVDQKLSLMYEEKLTLETSKIRVKEAITFLEEFEEKNWSKTNDARK